MLEVRQIAHDSLREMRAVVSGYRSTDLDSELAGAQSVLRSAGVSCRVIGDGSALPADTQTALGWVVREATTNVIRHSNATNCKIELDVNSEATTLRMENDGVARTAPANRHGTGLVGLRERLVEVGGTLTVEEPPGRFVLVGAASGGFMIRLLLADDENLIRTALAALLSLEDDLEVVGQAASADEALAMARLHRPDVAVLDLQMPGVTGSGAIGGIGVVEALRSEVPECACLIVTGHGRPGHLKRALAAGVRGFFPKTVSARYSPTSSARSTRRPVRRPRACRRSDQRRRQPAHAARDRGPRTRCRRRPIEQIARRASLSPGTVRNYLSSAATKLGTANRYESVQVARTHGWI